MSTYRLQLKLYTVTYFYSNHRKQKPNHIFIKISVKRVLNNGNQQGVVVQGAVDLSFWVDIAVSLAFIDGVNFVFSFFS